MAFSSSMNTSRRMNDSDENDDGDFSLLTKIPHGIKQKRSNRRKSTSSTTKGRTSSSSGIIGTVPLTAPRHNVNRSVSKKSLIKSQAVLDARLSSPSSDRNSKRRRQSGRFDTANESISREGSPKQLPSGLYSESGRNEAHTLNGQNYDDEYNDELLNGVHNESVNGERQEIDADANESTRDNSARNNNDSTRFTSGNQTNFHESSNSPKDDSYPHTPIENEIRTPLVSPEFSFKRRSLVGEVSGQRKIHKKNPTSDRIIDGIISKEGSGSANEDTYFPKRAANERQRREESLDENEDNDGSDEEDDDDDSVILENERLTRIHHIDIRKLANGKQRSPERAQVKKLEEHGYSNESPEVDRIAESINTTLTNGNGRAKPYYDESVSYNQTEDKEIFYSVTLPDVGSKKQSLEGNREENGISTPSRLTEAVAYSPRTEQESRIIDEAEISLDTSRPAKVEAPESPLTKHKQHKLLVVRRERHEGKNVAKNKRYSILDGEEILSELFKLANETNNNSRNGSKEESDTSFESHSDKPEFLIKQFTKIQNQHNEQLNTLKLELNSKNKELLKLSESLSKSNLKIQNLQNEVDTMNLLEKQLQERNELLSKEFEMFEKNVESLQSDVSYKDEKLSSYIKLSNKFKDLYRDKQIEINNLKKETSRQTAEIEVLTEEKSGLIEKLEYLEEKVEKLNGELKNSSSDYQDVKDQLKNLKENNEGMEEEVYGLRHVVETLESEKQDLLAELRKVKSQAARHEEESEKAQNRIDEFSKTVEDLKEEVHNLNNANENYKDDLKVKELENEQMQKEADEINSILNARNRKMEEYETHFDELNEKYLLALDETKQKLDELNDANNEISKLNAVIKSVQDENGELNEQISNLRDELVNAKGSLESDRTDYEELKEKYKASVDELAAKEKQLSEFHESLTKIEENHIEELEKIQHEVSGLQNSIGSKNKELLHLQEDNDSLAEENRKLSDSVAALTTELRAAKKQVEELKTDKYEAEKKTEERLTKLSEDLYIQYSKKHEQKIAILKKGYETKWQSKLNQASATIDALKREVQGLKDRLSNERKEKAELVKLWDKLVKMEDAGTKIQKA